jgi:hypothetical protein
LKSRIARLYLEKICLFEDIGSPQGNFVRKINGDLISTKIKKSIENYDLS